MPEYGFSLTLIWESKCQIKPVFWHILRSELQIKTNFNKIILPTHKKSFSWGYNISTKRN